MSKKYKQFAENQVETIIVDKKRNKLNEIEKEYGFKTITNSIESALKVCESIQSTSKILIHSGTYDLKPSEQQVIHYIARRNLEFIGIGNVKIVSSPKIPLLFKGDFTMNNIMLNGFFGISSNLVNLKNCTVEIADVILCGIMVIGEGNLKVENCVFYNPAGNGSGIGIVLSTRINLSSRANVSVRNSKFIGFNKSIDIDLNECYNIDDAQFGLKCIDNIFDDSNGISMSYRGDDDDVSSILDQCVLTGNKFSNPKDADPNK